MTQHQRTPDTSKPNQQTVCATGNKAAQEQVNAIQAALAPALENRKLSEIKDKKERLLALADILDRNALVQKGIGFNLGTWRATDHEVHDVTGNHCGTVGCIAGWALMYEEGANRRGSWAMEAQNLLELTYDQRELLFTPQVHLHLGCSYGAVTPQMAASVIRHLAETGRVEWKLFDTDGKRKS